MHLKIICLKVVNEKFFLHGIKSICSFHIAFSVFLLFNDPLLTAEDNIYSLLFPNNTNTLADGHFPTGLSSKKKLKYYGTRERCCNVFLLN